MADFFFGTDYPPSIMLGTSPVQKLYNNDTIVWPRTPTPTPSITPSVTPSLLPVTPSVTPTVTPSVSITPSVTPTAHSSYIAYSGICGDCSTFVDSVYISGAPGLTLNKYYYISSSLVFNIISNGGPGGVIYNCGTAYDTCFAACGISVTPSMTPSRTPSVTPSVTPSLSPVSPSVTPTITPSISITPTRTPSVTPTPSTSPPVMYNYGVDYWSCSGMNCGSFLSAGHVTEPYTLTLNKWYQMQNGDIFHVTSSGGIAGTIEDIVYGPVDTCSLACTP